MVSEEFREAVAPVIGRMAASASSCKARQAGLGVEIEGEAVSNFDHEVSLHLRPRRGRCGRGRDLGSRSRRRRFGRCNVGKTTILGLALPNRLAVVEWFRRPAVQREPSSPRSVPNVSRFLRQPSHTEQPVTPRAIANGDPSGLMSLTKASPRLRGLNRSCSRGPQPARHRTALASSVAPLLAILASTEFVHGDDHAQLPSEFQDQVGEALDRSLKQPVLISPSTAGRAMSFLFVRDR